MYINVDVVRKSKQYYHFKAITDAFKFPKNKDKKMKIIEWEPGKTPTLCSALDGRKDSLMGQLPLSLTASNSVPTPGKPET